MIKLLKSINTYILFLFVIYVVYYLSDHITAVLAGFELASTGSSTIGKIVTIVLFLLCIYKIRSSRTQLRSAIKYLLVSWCLVIVMSNLLCLSDVNSIINTSFQQLLWPIIFTYFYCAANELSRNLLSAVMTVLFLLCSYFVYQESIFLRYFGEYAEQLQVNEIYFVVLILPWVMSFEGIFFGKLKYVLLAIGLYLVFFSFKRTAMLCIAFGVMLYIVGLLKQKRIKVSHFFLISAILIGGYVLFDLVNEQSGGRIVERIELTKTDKGSNRLDIYDKVFDAVDDFTFADYLFGKGRGSIGKYTGGYSAHNEYLEVFFSWGIIAFAIYMLFLYHIAKNYKRLGSEDIPIYLMSLGIFASMSITSHLVIYPYLFNILVSYWGYSFAKK